MDRENRGLTTHGRADQLNQVEPVELMVTDGKYGKSNNDVIY
jgi:hypothetical protein